MSLRSDSACPWREVGAAACDTCPLKFKKPGCPYDKDKGRPWPPQEGDVWQFSHTPFGAWFKLDRRLEDLRTGDRRMAWAATCVRENISPSGGNERVGDSARILFSHDAEKSHSMWKFIDEG